MDDVQVSYTLRDVLDKISEQLTEIRASLGSKAEDADMTRLEDRVGQLERDKYRVYGIVLGLTVAGSTAGGAVVSAVGG